MNSAAPQTAGLADYLDIVDIALATISRRLPASVGREDLASAGKLALVVAVGRCEGTADEVRAYSFVRVRGAMLDELRRLDPLTRRERAEMKAGRTSEGAVRLAEQFADVDWDKISDDEAITPAESVEISDFHVCLRSALDRLPRNQALALRRYYLEDVNLDDIARELGVSRERARQVREAGEKKLRTDLLVLSLWQTVVQRRG
jgi:RNA polymerase sigma factor for flagellar operon FliA